MSYQSIEAQDIKYFKSIFPESSVRTDEAQLKENSADHTEDLSYQPEVVIFPTETAQIQAFLRYCNERRIPVTPRGAGTGLSGGAIPYKGGVSLDFRKMNRILKVDKENFQVTAEPGIITEVLQNHLSKMGLFYPVDPASRGSCFIGGNIAENSGGPRAVKYGTVKDYVLNLEVVLADGSVIETGANTLKNATGYDLTRLMVGSEGTLGIVTKITLRLLPYPNKRLILLAPFEDTHTAIGAVNEIMKAGANPSALEFMGRDALTLAGNYLGELPIPIPDHVQAHLLIEVDGNDMEDLYRQVDLINGVLEKLTKEDVLFAESEQQQNKLWMLRRVVGEATKSSSIYKEEDTVMPRAYLPDLLAFVKEKGKEYGFESVCYGHAGDGNLHVNILKKDLDDRQWEEEVPKAIEEIFKFVKSKGGTLSAEHGVGLVQKEYMPIVFSSKALDLMKGIKQLFDPNGILNPGKILP